MKTRTPLLVTIAVGLTAMSGSKIPAEPVKSRSVSVQDRLARQNQLFRSQYEDDLRLSPETATAYGDGRFNSSLDDRSLGGIQQRHRSDLDYRSALKAISVEGFNDQDRISHDLLLNILNQRVTDYDLKTYEMPLSQMDGVHTSLADLPLSVPLATVKDYEDYISRLRHIPEAFSQTMEVLRQGKRDHLMPARILLQQVPNQCEGIVSENPFVLPLKHFPSAISSSDQARLSAEITAVVNTAVLPAYKNFSKFVAAEYAPFGRISVGLSSLPGGARLYQNAIREQTSTTLTPEEIHALGIQEVARISGLMRTISQQQGFTDNAAYKRAIASNPRYVPQSADQIVVDFRQHIAEMEPHLSELFGLLPHTPLSVEEVPASQPGNGTHYIPGTSDGVKPARVVVATANFQHRTLINDETLAYHEGIPGHHMQVSIAQQLSQLPEYRRHLLENAYAEGWAVYAEALGKEIGFFKDPASDYGRLATELMRAVRLVIDTGIHSQGWTREQAVEYFRNSGAADEPVIQAEVDRYIAWPAQSLGYKIGQLKILELRERAKNRLGDRFDIRAFHDEVLGSGSLPLDMLEHRVDEWIRTQVASNGRSDIDRERSRLRLQSLVSVSGEK